MPDQWNTLDDLLSSPFGQAAVNAIGLPPLSAFSSGSIAPAVVDPSTVATSIFGTKFDFANRDSIIRALKAAFPVEQRSDGKTGLGFRGNGGLLAMDLSSGGGMVVPHAPVLVAAQTLAGHVPGLASIRPPDSCAPECHDADRLVPVIRETTSLIVQAVAKPGPVEGDVTPLLTALTGYHPDDFKGFDVQNVGGYLGEWRDRHGLELRKRTSDADRAVIAFTTVVAVANMLARTWHERDDAGNFFGVSIFKMHRYMSAIVHDLTELRRLVPTAAWATTTIPTRKPMLAGELWQGLYELAAVKAMQLLSLGEHSALRAIAVSMRWFADAVREGLLDPQPITVPATPVLPREQAGLCEAGNGYSDAYDDLPEDFCDKLPRAFRQKNVRLVTGELLCHMQRVLEIVRNLEEDTVSIARVEFRDGNGQVVEQVCGGTELYAVVCGELTPDAMLSLVNPGRAPVCGERVETFRKGIKYKFVLPAAAAGLWRPEVQMGDWKHVADVRLLVLPQHPPVG